MKIDFRHTHIRVISCFAVVLLIELLSLALTSVNPFGFLRLGLTVALFVFSMKGSEFAKNVFAVLLLLDALPPLKVAFRMQFQVQTVFFLYAPALVFVLIGGYLLLSTNVKQFMAEMRQAGLKGS